ncbi:hypothetical protein F4781DRAFT_126034 [Annulohypoxylon bovei var. microspora]|nr:hypothetical protein F4781DRAFT_126034 [Annulohypoxylon bovei var. microspora]
MSKLICQDVTLSLFSTFSASFSTCLPAYPVPSQPSYLPIYTKSAVQLRNHPEVTALLRLSLSHTCDLFILHTTYLGFSSFDPTILKYLSVQKWQPFEVNVQYAVKSSQVKSIIGRGWES